MEVEDISKKKLEPNDGSYTAKISQLLKIQDDRQCPPYLDEQLLVALVMLVNQHLVDDSSFQSIWIEHCQLLQRFSQRLLYLQCATSDTTNTMSTDIRSTHLEYARLVALIQERVLTAAFESKNSMFSTTASFLMNLLLNFFFERILPLQQQQSTAAKLPTMTVILECYHRYLNLVCSKQRAQVKEIKEQNMQCIWEGYVQGITLSGLPKEYGDNNQASSVSFSEEKEEDVMKSTLHAILEKINGRTEENKSKSKEETLQFWNDKLHIVTLSLFRDHFLSFFSHPESSNSVSFLWVWWIQQTLSMSSLLKETAKTDRESMSTQGTSYYAIQALPKKYQRQWHEVLLLFARCAASLPSLPSMLEANDNLGPAVLWLFLIHLMSSGSSNVSKSTGNMHLLAWTACAAWVDRMQSYYWTIFDKEASNTNPSLPAGLKMGSSSKGLGAVSQLCALVRLASGEWRIQLGYRLTKQEEAGTSLHASSQSTDKDRAGIIQATSQILAVLVIFLGELADALEDRQMRPNKQDSISPDALLHLRDSLEDTLQATSNYLCHLSKLSPIPRLDAEDVVCVQLLGMLLSNFDVFDAQAKIDTDEILVAVGFAMSHCEDNQAQAQVITSLLGIMEMAKDDKYRVLLLKERNLLGEDLLSFLQKYWENMIYMTTEFSNFESSLPWACQLTETWFSILVQHSCDLRIQIDPLPLTRSIIQWLKCILSNQSLLSSDKGEVLQALNSAIGCYVALHGQSPPEESEGQVLQCALQYCATHCQM